MAADPSPKQARRGESLGGALYAFFDGLALLGLWGGGAVAAAVGQFFLASVLALLGLGVFLRFKRLRLRRRAKRG